jgi:hypothetical protein
MNGVCKSGKRGVFRRLPHPEVRKTQGQKGQNITKMLYKLAILSQNDSINVIFLRFPAENGKTKHPPLQTLFMRGF